MGIPCHICWFNYTLCGHSGWVLLWQFKLRNTIVKHSVWRRHKRNFSKSFLDQVEQNCNLIVNIHLHSCRPGKTCKPANHVSLIFFYQWKFCVCFSGIRETLEKVSVFCLVSLGPSLDNPQNAQYKGVLVSTTWQTIIVSESHRIKIQKTKKTTT
jgi:hypothetical protein